MVALFFTTSFSCNAAHALLCALVNSLDPIGRIKARWSAWRKKREQERLRKRVEANKVSGRVPVPPQTLGPKERRIPAEDEKRAREAVEDEDDDPVVAKHVLEIPEIPPAPSSASSKKAASEPKISAGATAFRLPSPRLLRVAARSEKD